jgi:hypothetical protein
VAESLTLRETRSEIDSVAVALSLLEIDCPEKTEPESVAVEESPALKVARIATVSEAVLASLEATAAPSVGVPSEKPKESLSETDRPAKTEPDSVKVKESLDARDAAIEPASEAVDESEPLRLARIVGVPWLRVAESEMETAAASVGVPSEREAESLSEIGTGEPPPELPATAPIQRPPGWTAPIHRTLMGTLPVRPGWSA